jgi:hypothetical protein
VIDMRTEGKCARSMACVLLKQLGCTPVAASLQRRLRG